jgi:hypothetical protein
MMIFIMEEIIRQGKMNSKMPIEREVISCDIYLKVEE